MRKIFFVAICLSALLLGACQQPYRLAFDSCSYRMKTGECARRLAQDADIAAVSAQAIDRLLQDLQGTFHPDNRLWVTSIADLDNLDVSSSLGRLLGEQAAAHLVQLGYTVLEPKMDNELTVKPYTGEFVLSRYMRDVGQRQRVNAVLTGTYVVGTDTVYVTLKLVEFAQGRMLASQAYNLPIGPNTYALLRRPLWWW